MMTKIDYTVATSLNFEAAVSRVEEEIAKAGLRVLYIHDVQKSLAEKGFARAPLKIVEFCNAQIADEFLRTDIRISLCLPCKINLYVEDGKTFIAGLRPIMLSQFFPEADLSDRLKEVDKKIKTIINNVA